MSASLKHECVLALHPTSRGFGWAVLDAPDTLLDWGLVHAAKMKSDRLTKRLDRLIAIYRPDALVLEEYEGETSKRAERIKALLKTFEQTAKSRGVPVLVYGQDIVTSALDLPAGTSRYEIAKAVLARFEDLSHRMPPKRKLGNAEDVRQSLFAAVALAVTRYTVLGLA